MLMMPHLREGQIVGQDIVCWFISNEPNPPKLAFKSCALKNSKSINKRNSEEFNNI